MRPPELGKMKELVKILTPRRSQVEKTGEAKVKWICWSTRRAEVISQGGAPSVEAYEPSAVRTWQFRLRYHPLLYGRGAVRLNLVWQTWQLQVQKSEDLEGMRRFVWLTCEATE